MKWVGSEMTHELITVGADSSLDEAYQLMAKNKIRHLPVLGYNNEIVGILSDRDLQRSMQSKIAEPFGIHYETVDFPKGVKVRDYMTSPVQTFPATTDIKLVVYQMLEDKVSAYLITNDQGVVGIVTTDDLLYLLMRMLDDQEEGEELQLTEIVNTPFLGRVAQTLSDVGI